MVPLVNVLAVATAVPPHLLEQRVVADAARQVYARTFRASRNWLTCSSMRASSGAIPFGRWNG